MLKTGWLGDFCVCFLKIGVRVILRIVGLEAHVRTTTVLCVNWTHLGLSSRVGLVARWWLEGVSAEKLGRGKVPPAVPSHLKWLFLGEIGFFFEISYSVSVRMMNHPYSLSKLLPEPSTDFRNKKGMSVFSPLREVAALKYPSSGRGSQCLVRH